MRSDGWSSWELGERVPAGVVAAARDALRWRVPGAELATVEYDSFLDDGGVRGGVAERLLSFECGELTVELHTGRTLVGQLVPATAARIVCRQIGGDPLATSSDALGRFAFPDLQARTVSLVVDLQDGGPSSTVVTEWISI